MSTKKISNTIGVDTLCAVDMQQLFRVHSNCSIVATEVRVPRNFRTGTCDQTSGGGRVLVKVSESGALLCSTSDCCLFYTPYACLCLVELDLIRNGGRKEATVAQFSEPEDVRCWRAREPNLTPTRQLYYLHL